MLAMLWWAGTADIGTISDQVLAVWAQRFGQTRRWRRVTAEILARRDTRAEAIEQLQHPDLANDPKAQALLTKLRGQ